MKATRSRDVAAGTTALAALGKVDASKGSSSESVGVVGMELSADSLMATLLRKLEEDSWAGKSAEMLSMRHKRWVAFDLEPEQMVVPLRVTSTVDAVNTALQP
jgi:hypothetical protein